MSGSLLARPLRGVVPVAPTPFDDDGEVDYAGQLRVLDFLVDAGVDAICVLANYSEQFSLTDAERARLTTLCLDHVAGRVPVVVTTSHYSSRVAAERCRQAQAAGAAMVMLMPPYHGATIRPDEPEIFNFFQTVAVAIDIPIMIQDAPVSGVSLSATFLARLASEIDNVQYAKIEVPSAAAKLRDLVARAGDALPGPFDGEESITLLPDLDAGATGTMPSAVQPELLRVIVERYQLGDRPGAIELYERSLPLILYENRQCGLRAAKVLMHEGGIIGCELARAPMPTLHPATRAGLVALAHRIDPLILRWA
ncbi:MAG: dihydrodipicolinate synthase family protein [Chloroflexi bacterium]|nr:dihydrodipicolinate synthase family protein [Chloroflexota bacterium]